MAMWIEKDAIRFSNEYSKGIAGSIGKDFGSAHELECEAAEFEDVHLVRTKILGLGEPKINYEFMTGEDVWRGFDYIGVISTTGYTPLYER